MENGNDALMGIIKHLYYMTLTATLLLVCGVTFVYAQRKLDARQTSSGGPLMPEQAAYDVKSYDLNLRVDPAEQSIKGVLTTHALIVRPIDWFVLDLDNLLAVDSVALIDPVGKTQKRLHYERRDGRLWVAFPKTRQPAEDVRVRVACGGKPRVAPRPPWIGGFVWSKTPSGQPWVGVACQGEGAG